MPQIRCHKKFPLPYFVCITQIYNWNSIFPTDFRIWSWCPKAKFILHCHPACGRCEWQCPAICLSHTKEPHNFRIRIHATGKSVLRNSDGLRLGSSFFKFSLCYHRVKYQTLDRMFTRQPWFIYLRTVSWSASLTLQTQHLLSLGWSWKWK